MRRVVPLKSQTKQLNIVIRKDKQLKDVKGFCERYFERYAFIEHKEDIQPTTHLVEGCHYHIVADAKDKGVSLFTRINQIIEYFNLKDAIGIEIDKYTDYIGAMQYLIHKNNPEKTPHDISEVVHNLEANEFKLIMNAERNEVITFDLLYEKVVNSKNIMEVIRYLGLKTYKEYRNIIWDIWKCVRAYARGEDDDTIM